MCLRSSPTAAGSLSITDLEAELGGASLHHCKLLPCFSLSHLHGTMCLTPFHQEKSHRLWSSLAPWSYLDASPVRAKHLLLYVSFVVSLLRQWRPQPSSQKLCTVLGHHHQTGTSTLWSSWAPLPPYPRKLVASEKKTILFPFNCSFNVFPGHGRYTLRYSP